jgi:hypothetical protein
MMHVALIDAMYYGAGFIFCLVELWDCAWRRRYGDDPLEYVRRKNARPLMRGR